MITWRLNLGRLRVSLALRWHPPEKLRPRLDFAAAQLREFSPAIERQLWIQTRQAFRRLSGESRKAARPTRALASFSCARRRQWTYPLLPKLRLPARP